MSLSYAKLEQLEKQIAITSSQHILIDYQTYTIDFFGENTKRYVPSKTQLAFHKADSNVKLIMGAFGSGKTSTNCMEIIFNASKMPYCKDGIRRYRALIFRNTFEQLKKGAFDSWMTWCETLGVANFKTGNELYAHHIFNDGYGTIDLELWFIPVNSSDDVHKFKSYNATAAFINELSEFPLLGLQSLPGRLGRYPQFESIDNNTVTKWYEKDIQLPNGQMLYLKVPYWYGIHADTNPTNTRHFVYRLFEAERIPEFKLFKQPPGLLIDEKDGSYYPNPDCDNYGIGIPKDYYLNLSKGATKEFINVYCQGHWGIVADGDPIYPQYNDDLHAVDKIELNKSESLIITLDGGFTPAALLQQCYNGQYFAIKEFVTERMYLEELVENKVLAYINSTFSIEERKTIEIMWIGDPAITQRETEALSNLGIDLLKADTNEIEPRVQSVIYFLNRMSSGSPGFQISKKNCPVLREGFNGEYKFKKLRVIGENKSRKERPEKIHPVSDIHDCCQYGALHFVGNMVKKESIIDSRSFLHKELL